MSSWMWFPINGSEDKPLSNKENIRVKKWEILLFLLYLLDKEPVTIKSWNFISRLSVLQCIKINEPRDF